MSKKAPSNQVPNGPVDPVTAGVTKEIEKFQQAMSPSQLFSPPSPDVPKQDGVIAWNALATLADIFTSQRDLWREYLLNLAEKEGATTQQGGQAMDVEGTAIIRERRKSKLPDEAAVKELLAKNSIPMMECFDVVPTLVFNPSKLDFLIQSNKISADQVEAAKKVTWALKVKPSELLDSLLERLRAMFNVAPRRSKLPRE